MLVSYQWLRQFVDIPKAFTPLDVANRLTASTVEVESVSQQDESLAGVVVGEVTTLEKHPNADKLSLVTVADSHTTYQVVCGGSNLRLGMKVAFAKVGSRVRWHGQGDWVELKPATIRGVDSNGMICAGSELELADLFPGGERDIADLSAMPAEVGTPLAEALGRNDAVIEIDNKSMTNRPDLWGHYGLARELSALYQVPLASYDVPKIKSGRSQQLSVTVADTQLCPRYLGVVVSHLTVGPSPDWLVKRLAAAGVRSVSVLVDITNYVMLELGQPLHAFDWKEITDGTITVSPAVAGEKFTTLDGVQRTLDDRMLLIRDGKRPVALAGIMGGENSAITVGTQSVLFEAATFSAAAIRRTSMKLGLRSESSARFEKGLDPAVAELAIRKAVALTLELIPGAKVASRVVDVFAGPAKPIDITVAAELINRRIGITLPAADMVDILTRLGFTAKATKQGMLTVRVPSWRATGDISTPEDIIEEIARVHGYETIVPVLPTIAVEAPQPNLVRAIERQLKNFLAGAPGMTELSRYTFISRADAARFGIPAAALIALKNTLSADQEVLRSTLVPSAVAYIQDSLRFTNSIRAFELSRVFEQRSGTDRRGLNSDVLLPYQGYRLLLAVTDSKQSEPFFDVKGVVEALSNRLNVDIHLSVPTGAVPAWAEPGRTIGVFVRGEYAGVITELRRSIGRASGIEQPVGLAEIDFDLLAGAAADDRQYQPLPKFPSSVRDLAVVLNTAVPWEEVKKAIKTAGAPLVSAVELFDVYVGDTIPTGKRSLACHITYSAPDRTLTSEEVTATEQRIEQQLGTLGAMRRS